MNFLSDSGIALSSCSHSRLREIKINSAFSGAKIISGLIQINKLPSNVIKNTNFQTNDLIENKNPNQPYEKQY